MAMAGIGVRVEDDDWLLSATKTKDSLRSQRGARGCSYHEEVDGAVHGGRALLVVTEFEFLSFDTETLKLE